MQLRGAWRTGVSFWRALLLELLVLGLIWLSVGLGAGAALACSEASDGASSSHLRVRSCRMPPPCGRWAAVRSSSVAQVIHHARFVVAAAVAGAGALQRRRPSDEQCQRQKEWLSSFVSPCGAVLKVPVALLANVGRWAAAVNNR